MELFEYIKSQLPQMPNSAIMKQMGASEELIDYVKETPWNTNLNVVGSITGSGEDDEPEIWFTGENPTVAEPQTIFNLVDVGGIDHAQELYNNGAKYKVYLNGEELTIYDAESHGWANTDDTTAEFYTVAIFEEEGVYSPMTIYMNTTAPTSVEVSVIKKPEPEAEVWLVGDNGVEQAGMMTFVLSNIDATDHLTELATNGVNYKVFLNGVELPYFTGDEGGSGWSDTNDYSTMTKSIEIYSVDETSSGMVAYKPASIAPTSVEVSVKAK